MREKKTENIQQNILDRSKSVDEREIVKVRWSKQIMKTCWRYIKASSNWHSRFFFFHHLNSFIIYLSAKWQKQEHSCACHNTLSARKSFEIIRSKCYFYFVLTLCVSHFTACKNPIKSPVFRFQIKTNWWNKG